ncbi:uncharacterized protein LOC129913692 [Episyrphus balteatus]|uniref:uncharacterized protein LOC129913692 n=1 Tax=Episyrphus balteatus TaxID=286459 RepID=UPI002485649C|nr:uncharacterized protein LOC129913692 [Episyrphus balteatus]
MDYEELDLSYGKSRKLKWQNEKSKKPSLVDMALDVAAKEGINAMADLYQNIEPQIVKNGQILEDNHPAALLSKFSAPVEGNERSAMAAYATLSATKAFRRNNKESAVLGRQAQSQKVSFRRTPLEGLCPPRDPPTCMPASQRYRTHDGTCNNRRRLRWGSAQMPFNRFLPPEYGDGVDSIRGSVEGGSLSSARFVSLLVHGAREGEAPLTLMIVQWGQLLDHDMTSTAQPRSINGSVPSCCGSKDFHPLCFPIKVPLDDPWLAPLKVRCLEFLRSAPAQRRDCVLSWREQTNQVTSYIDASPIYSSNAKTSDNARIFRNGLLIYGRGDPADDVCMRGAIAHQCIRSGDGRSGEQPGLLALHHVWVGEHNRIAMELSILNPHWSDEKVYQETRRIIGALFQHITFREFLPIVLGREVCKLFDLELVKSGYYTGYDANINPSVSNAFAAAAFRFGHSLVQNTYMRCDRNHNFINNNVTLHEEFQQGDIGTAGSLHRLLRGLAAQKALKRDEFITPELTNHLFQTPGFPFGLDLAAINIQRGRDHGVAPYTAWRQPCGLSAINSWDDLSNIVGPESAKRISHAYRNVHDIDLFVGGIAERPVIGGLVGPTFACIIAQQFSNARKGDRFWYENSGFESSFTPAQLNSLRHVSLSSVLCRAINGGTLQPYVFLPNDAKGNQRIKCGKDSLEPIDLRPWLEQDPFLMMNNDKMDQNPSLHDDSPISTSLTNKEEKGINNRIENVTMVANVDFIPNSSIGFHRVANMTKIHDKLDMAQKLLVTRPSTKPIRGVNNKLDKHRLSIKSNPKPTLAPLSKRISTTRRTVVIHNVQIELRSASGVNKDQKPKKKKHDESQSSLASTAQNTILKVAGVVKSQISAAMGFLSNNDDDDTSTKHLSRKLNDRSQDVTRLTNATSLTNTKQTANLPSKGPLTDELSSNVSHQNDITPQKSKDETSDFQTAQTELIRNLTKDYNKIDNTDIDSKLETARNSQNIDIPRNTIDITLSSNNITNFYQPTDTKITDISTESDNSAETSNNTHTKIVPAKLTNLLRNSTKEKTQPKNTVEELTNSKTEISIIVQNTDNANKIMDQTALTRNYKIDITTENDISTKTSNNTILTETLFKNSTKEYNETELTSEELTTSKTETLKLTDSFININDHGNHTNTHNQTNSEITDIIDNMEHLTDIEEISEISLHKPTKHFNEPPTDSTDKLREPHETYKDFQAIINSALQDSLDQHKRVHRKTDHKNVQVKKVELHTNLDFVDKLRTLRLDKTKEFTDSQLTDSEEFYRTADIELNENNLTESINTEQPSATLRNMELRQRQERPIYNRPQKVILDGPESDQYEIEINIRQTNTRPPHKYANYQDYNNPNKHYDPDRHDTNYDYKDQHPNTPSNSFFSPTTRIPYGTRTKPPTIIYINEHDDRTTRGPGIFQNILSFATNGFNSINKQTTSTESPFNPNPNRVVNNGHNSENYLSSHSSRPYQHSKPENYLSAQQPPPQPYPPVQGFPPHGFSQVPPNYNTPPVVPPQGFPPPNIYPPQPLPGGANSFSTVSNIGGVAHASSNAVSTGHFGAIAGSASSNGGDSTFSFNIRPSARPQLNLMTPTGIKPDYELLPQHQRPQFSSTPSYAYPPKPMPSVESFQYPPNKHDPFSSYTRRPPPYFNKLPTNVFDPAYDDIGRSELKIDDSNQKTNQTKDNTEDFDSDDYDYQDDDIDSFGSNIFKNDNVVDDKQQSIENDKIDYLKLAEQAMTNRTKLNETDFDDNFVLPVLRRSDTIIESTLDDELSGTNPTIVEQKSFGHDILAEDYDELLTGRASFLDSQTSFVTGQWNKLKKPAINEQVAFAPIQILTKPERPDNWVIFDTSDEKPLLPVQPDFNTDTLAAAEVPMPFQKRKTSRVSIQTVKPNDIDVSTNEPTNTDLTVTTLTTEQSSEPFATEISDELSTSVELLTKDFEQDMSMTTTDETDFPLLLNSKTEKILETDSLDELGNSTDLTKTFSTDSQTDELTTVTNLT